MSFIVGRHIAASCVRALTHTAWRCRAVGASCKCVDVALQSCLLTLFSRVKDLSPLLLRQRGMVGVEPVASLVFYKNDNRTGGKAAC